MVPEVSTGPQQVWEEPEADYPAEMEVGGRQRQGWAEAKPAEAHPVAQTVVQVGRLAAWVWEAEALRVPSPEAAEAEAVTSVVGAEAQTPIVAASMQAGAVEALALPMLRPLPR